MIAAAIGAAAIGAAAWRLLQQDQPAVLAGQTSRGAFLSLASGEPVFLSLESFRGPLTVNISGEARLLRELPIKSAAHIQSQEIIFEQSELSIQTASAETWLAPPRPESLLSEPARRVFREAVLQQAVQRAEAESLLALVAAVLSGGAAVAEHPLRSSVLAIKDHLPQRHPELAAAAMRPVLGYGRGLTPSGDDLLLGLLLALNRWGEFLAPGLDIDTLNRLAISQATQRSTTLSASLIACAAQGQADERLLTALDGLLCGGVPAENLVAKIAGWGNTSGLDALAGMFLAIANISSSNFQAIIFV